MSHPEGPGPGGASTDAHLAAYGRWLIDAAFGLRDAPYGQLRAAVGRAREILSSAGPRLARDAVWLTQREDYLADAAARLTDGAQRLEVALASPAESDLSVRVTALRESVGYFADVTADMVPAPAYLDVGRDLLPLIEGTYAAPGLGLALLPLLEQVLDRLGLACGFAATLTAKADAALRRPVPGETAGFPPRRWVDGVHRAEIERLIRGLHGARPGLASRPREDAGTHERAIRECLDLTPRQLYSVLARFTGP